MKKPIPIRAHETVERMTSQAFIFTQVLAGLMANPSLISPSAFGLSDENLNVVAKLAKTITDKAIAEFNEA